MISNKINQICKDNCKRNPVYGSGILNVYLFCCVKGFNLILEDIRKRYNLK